MVLLPQNNPIKEALDAIEPSSGIEEYKIVINNKPRDYMGMSGVGSECMRFLQYQFRRAYKRELSRRMERLMNFGNVMEPIFERDLRAIGADVYDDQLEIVGFAGHWKGHIDGKVINLPACEKTEHLGEFKTHNDNNFKKLLSSQSVQESFPKHYDQMIAYMGHLKLKRALYLGYNKNTSEYYIERVYFNQDRFDELEHKMMEVVVAEQLYPRIGNGKSTWFGCKFCDAKKICYNDAPIEKNCRTCKYVDILDEGKWECSKGKELELCDEYELEEMLK